MSREKLIVDPGFVHHRKILTILQEQGSRIINQEIRSIPPTTPEWHKRVLIDQIYTRILIEFCRVNEIKTLEEILLEKRGRLFCSIVKLKPCQKIYEKGENDRIVLEPEAFEGSELTLELHITLGHVTASTLKAELECGGNFAVIAEYFASKDNKLIFHPLVIGFPYIQDIETGEPSWTLYSDFYNLYIEDFDEFSKVKEQDMPEDFKEMKQIKESLFKAALGKILSESTPKDWGGETSDFTTSHLHYQGKRLRAAFLLKGPAKFTPMTIKHLGKNGDQIIRLAKEPVDILIVQHCHDITSSVIEMLKIFATQPSNPRYYCLLDGRESLRLLEAYDLKKWALNESKKG
ncbi:hypothetical protein [Okeania sp. SIO1I7]|uniref:hypothetical protein n=1 Tax=Okeania sp. SIO1I7 TaxID=2607772 RepID=UPI0013F6F572|nr:hypothetical protein [Okeania sp. SIO1I7]NET27681.1 hypothetical protein [Okeania sp. SIO1I7]